MKTTLMIMGALAALFGGAGCASDEPVTRTETTTTTEEHIVRKPVTTTTTEEHVLRPAGATTTEETRTVHY